MRTYFVALTCVLLFMNSVLARADLAKEQVSYKDGKTELQGVLVYDSAVSDKRPGILVVHDWMGLTDKTLIKADQIAKLGYVVFAADVYGKDVRPKNSEEAAALAGTYKKDRNLFRSRLVAAQKTLKDRKNLVDQKRIGAVGYCFGGTGVLELARSGADLVGVVSFHGGLDSPSPKDGKKIKGRVLALHGAIDPFVSAQDLSAFEKEMIDSKVDWQIIKYGGAVHSFTDPHAGKDPSKGAAYNEKADKRSWVAMTEFFNEVFTK